MGEVCALLNALLVVVVVVVVVTFEGNCPCRTLLGCGTVDLLNVPASTAFEQNYDCLLDETEDREICSVPYCVGLLHCSSVICMHTQMIRLYRCLLFSFSYLVLFSCTFGAFSLALTTQMSSEVISTHTDTHPTSCVVPLSSKVVSNRC